jgi:hypothetical protein
VYNVVNSVHQLPISVQLPVSWAKRSRDNMDRVPYPYRRLLDRIIAVIIRAQNLFMLVYHLGRHKEQKRWAGHVAARSHCRDRHIEIFAFRRRVGKVANARGHEHLRNLSRLCQQQNGTSGKTT